MSACVELGVYSGAGDCSPRDLSLSFARRLRSGLGCPRHRANVPVLTTSCCAAGCAAIRYGDSDSVRYHRGASEPSTAVAFPVSEASTAVALLLGATGSSKTWSISPSQLDLFPSNAATSPSDTDANMFHRRTPPTRTAPLHSLLYVILPATLRSYSIPSLSLAFTAGWRGCCTAAEHANTEQTNSSTAQLTQAVHRPFESSVLARLTDDDGAAFSNFD